MKPNVAPITRGRSPSICDLPPPWTIEQLAEIDKARSILDKITISGPQDIDLVSQLFRFPFLSEVNILRMRAIQDRRDHYRNLKQYAAKVKYWQKIYDETSRLSTELYWWRQSRLRDGANPQ